jgi:hypothetical protein
MPTSSRRRHGVCGTSTSVHTTVYLPLPRRRPLPLRSAADSTRPVDPNGPGRYPSFHGRPKAARRTGRETDPPVRAVGRVLPRHPGPSFLAPGRGHRQRFRRGWDLSRCRRRLLRPVQHGGKQRHGGKRRHVGRHGSGRRRDGSVRKRGHRRATRRCSPTLRRAWRGRLHDRGPVLRVRPRCDPGHHLQQGRPLLHACPRNVSPGGAVLRRGNVRERDVLPSPRNRLRLGSRVLRLDAHVHAGAVWVTCEGLLLDGPVRLLRARGLLQRHVQGRLVPLPAGWGRVQESMGVLHGQLRTGCLLPPHRAPLHHARRVLQQDLRGRIVQVTRPSPHVQPLLHTHPQPQQVPVRSWQPHQL